MVSILGYVQICLTYISGDTLKCNNDLYDLILYFYWLVGITDMNDRSSRSHTIFRIIIESLEVGIDESDDTGKAVKVNTSNNCIYNIGSRLIFKHGRVIKAYHVFYFNVKGVSFEPSRSSWLRKSEANRSCRSKV